MKLFCFFFLPLFVFALLLLFRNLFPSTLSINSVSRSMRSLSCLTAHFSLVSFNVCLYRAMHLFISRSARWSSSSILFVSVAVIYLKYICVNLATHLSLTVWFRLCCVSVNSVLRSLIFVALVEIALYSLFVWHTNFLLCLFVNIYINETTTWNFLLSYVRFVSAHTL